MILDTAVRIVPHLGQYQSISEGDHSLTIISMKMAFAKSLQIYVEYHIYFLHYKLFHYVDVMSFVFVMGFDCLVLTAIDLLLFYD